MTNFYTDYYVYAYIDPRNNIPFYIGRGRGKRDTSHLFPSKWLTFFHNKLQKLLKEKVTPTIRRLLNNLTYQESCDWECFFIAALGRRDLKMGPLCNGTDGGEGRTSPSPKEQLSMKKRYSERMLKLWKDSKFIKRQKELKSIRWADPEFQKKLHEGIQKYRTRPEIKERDSKRMSKMNKSKTSKKRSSKTLKTLHTLSEFKRCLRYSRPSKGKQFIGVGKHGNKWRARHSGHWLGCFKTELEAASAYNDAVDKFWGGDGWKNRVDNISIKVDRRKT